MSYKPRQHKVLWFLRVIKSLLINQYALMMEYRAEIALWALSGILPLIMLGLWSQTNIQDLIELQGFNLKRYFLSAFVVRQFTVVWVIFSFEEDIVQGRLSPFLLQPVPLFWRYYTSHIAEQITRVPIVALMIMILSVVLPNSFWLPKFTELILTTFVIFLAFTVRFMIHWAFAMSCFWVERASSIERLLLIPYLFFSGLVAPIDTFPKEISQIAYLTPYPYLLSFPANLLSGHHVNIQLNIMILIFWALFLFLISTLAWKKGVKHFTAMGA